MRRLTKSQEGVFGVHKYKHSSEEVFVHDVSLDVVGVVLHTEGQKLQDECQQLSCLKVVYKGQRQSFFKTRTLQYACKHITHSILQSCNYFKQVNDFDQL